MGKTAKTQGFSWKSNNRRKRRIFQPCFISWRVMDIPCTLWLCQNSYWKMKLTGSSKRMKLHKIAHLLFFSFLGYSDKVYMYSRTQIHVHTYIPTYLPACLPACLPVYPTTYLMPTFYIPPYLYLQTYRHAYITLHYVMLRYVTLHCLTLQYVTLRYIRLHNYIT